MFQKLAGQSQQEYIIDSSNKLKKKMTSFSVYFMAGLNIIKITFLSILWKNCSLSVLESF